MQVCTEAPSPHLDRFYGTYRMVGSVRPISVDMKNLLVRGSEVRNTEYCYGVVVYTGKDTRLVRNNNKVPLNSGFWEQIAGVWVCT